MVQAVVITPIIVTITEIMIVLITAVMIVMMIVMITVAEDKVMAHNAHKVALTSHNKAGVTIVEEETTTVNVLQITISKAGQAVPAEDKIIFPGLYVAKGPQSFGALLFFNSCWLYLED